MKHLYRYEIQYSNYDGDSTDIVLIEYKVMRETDYQYYIDDGSTTYALFNRYRKCKKHAMNTFAYDNKKEAMKHFIRRTEKRIRWYMYWTEECEKSLEIANKMKE